MADDTAPEKNTTGEIDPSKWDEAVAVTGRPVDVASANSTFAERAKVRSGVRAAPEEKPAKSTPRRKS